jgi:bZIP transcription factor
MERKIQRHDKIGSLGASMEVKRTTMDAAGASTGPRGNDTDEDDDNDDESLGTSGAELPQPGKVAATEGDSGEPDKYAKLRREKRLAMNRESARNRRKQKQVLIKSLEEQVAELRKTNQQYQITIESLSSKNRTLENELTMSRITIAQLSNANTANAGIAAPQQHHLFGGSLIPHHQQPLQLQQIPTSLEQTTQTNLQQQQQHQQHTLFSTIGTSSGAQNVFDSVFSNQTPLSMAMTGALMSNNESNTNTQDSNYFFQTTTNPLPTSLAQASGTVGANVSTSTEQPQPSTSANRAVATSSSSSTSGVGNNLSRLLQAQRDHMSMHRGSAISGGSMYTPEPVGTPMFTQTWDVPTSMDDSLFGTVNMGPAISNWQGMQQPNVMRNIETDTAIRGNLTTTSQSEIAHVSC